VQSRETCTETAGVPLQHPHNGTPDAPHSGTTHGNQDADACFMLSGLAPPCAPGRRAWGRPGSPAAPGRRMASRRWPCSAPAPSRRCGPGGPAPAGFVTGVCFHRPLLPRDTPMNILDTMACMHVSFLGLVGPLTCRVNPPVPAPTSSAQKPPGSWCVQQVVSDCSDTEDVQHSGGVMAQEPLYAQAGMPWNRRRTECACPCRSSSQIRRSHAYWHLCQQESSAHDCFWCLNKLRSCFFSFVTMR